MENSKIISNKITPFLWFNDKAEEAANFYASIFKNSKITSITYYGEAGPGQKGAVMSVVFELDGQTFYALNGGPHFTFTPAISFFVNCQTQAEVDELWEKLATGGKKGNCGWLEDQYGLSWQVVPAGMTEILNGKDPVKSQRAMTAMMQMSKLDLKKLKEAYENDIH